MIKEIAAYASFLAVLIGWVSGQSVRLIPKISEKRIDVLIDGSLFTAYRWDDKIMRPVLYPVMTVGGGFITRGFPFETRNGDTVDHPHQVGCSLSYGSVNGIDFWNSSTFRSPKEMEKMGAIIHQKVLRLQSGKKRGELVTRSIWTGPNGKAILLETSRYSFRVEGKIRWIERETNLISNDGDVVFGDSKEGMFSIHLSSELEQDDQNSSKITSTDGVTSLRTSKEGLSGRYINSDGDTGDQVWGTLAKWAAVSGSIGDEKVTVALFDSPVNLHFPSYNMVRGYGLLALNPFGQKLFDKNKEVRKFVLRAHHSITFHHALVIFPEIARSESIEREYQKFIH